RGARIRGLTPALGQPSRTGSGSTDSAIAVCPHAVGRHEGERLLTSPRGGPSLRHPETLTRRGTVGALATVRTRPRVGAIPRRGVCGMWRIGRATLRPRSRMKKGATRKIDKRSKIDRDRCTLRWWLQRDSNPCFSRDHVFARFQAKFGLV